MLDAINGQGGFLKINAMELEIDLFSLVITPINADITSNKSNKAVERSPVVQDWRLTCKCHLPAENTNALSVIDESEYVTEIELGCGGQPQYFADAGVVETATLDNDTIDVARWDLSILGSSYMYGPNSGQGAPGTRYPDRTPA